MCGTEFLIEGLVANGDRAEKEIAVAADIFSESLHGDIHAVGECVKVNSCGPSVIEDYESTRLVSGFGDGGNVLDFHRD